MTPLACISMVYAAMSTVTFLVYVFDKRAAQLTRPRTSESILHTLELLGGWPGAFLAQRLIRHKNSKVNYQIVFWLIVAVHVSVWVAIARWR